MYDSLGQIGQWNTNKLLSLVFILEVPSLYATSLVTTIVLKVVETCVKVIIGSSKT